MVQAEFFSFSKNLSGDIVTHIGRYEGLILRMQQMNVKPDESSFMVKILDSVLDDYESLGQAWWAENHQTFTNLVEVLTSDEKRRQQRTEKQEELVALMASKTKIQSKSGRDNVSANKTQLKKPGQVKPTGSSKDKNPRPRCYHCGGLRHICRNCKKRKGGHAEASKGESKDEAFVCETLSAEDDDIWIVDSGATNHVTHHAEWFSLLERFATPVKIYIGDKSTMDAIGRGTINF